MKTCDYEYNNIHNYQNLENMQSLPSIICHPMFRHPHFNAMVFNL